MVEEDSTQVPILTAESLYITELSNSLGEYGNLATLGILAPIQIVNPGVGYKVNDVITFTGSVGLGANAIITSVNITGSNTYNSICSF